MERLRQLREQHNKTQADVADFLKVGRNTISRYENADREPDSETLKKLAEYFDTTTSYLIGETDDPTPPNKKTTPDISTQEALMIALRGMLGRHPTDEELKRYLEVGKLFFNVQD